MRGIIFTCDKCLEELLISQGDSEPIDPSEMVDKCPEAKDWIIPDLVMEVTTFDGKKGHAPVPASSIKCLCPKCAKPELTCPACHGKLFKKKDTGEGIKHCSECGSGWFILKTSG